MKLKLDQIEDILIVGEAKAAQQNRKLDLYLLRTEAEVEDAEWEDGTKYRNLGFQVTFRPAKEKVRIGISELTAQESEVYDLWETSKDGKEWKREHGLAISYSDLIERRAEFEDEDYLIESGKTYSSWDYFAKDFGITALVPVSTKVPKPLAVKLDRITREEGETPSWRVRLLIQEYLEEKIADRVRRVMFAEDS